MLRRTQTVPTLEGMEESAAKPAKPVKNPAEAAVQPGNPDDARQYKPSPFGAAKAPAPSGSTGQPAAQP